MQFQIVADLDPGTTMLKDSSTISWYHEKVIESERLLICIGDSWTWGYSLGKTNPEINYDNYNHRITNIFGTHLSHKLNADFVNIGRPGGTNLEMYCRLKSILPQVHHRYKEIYVVVTLTENMREIAYSTEWPLIEESSQEFDSLNSIFKQYEHKMFTKFNDVLEKYTNVHCVIGRNFTFSFDQNFNVLQGRHLDRTWVEILAENQSLPAYPNNLRLLSQMTYDPLIKYLKEQKLFDRFKKELFEIFCCIDDATTWLDTSALNYKKGTKHPTEIGHQLWANYLYGKFNKYQYA